jgi:hypothetical protein
MSRHPVGANRQFTHRRWLTHTVDIPSFRAAAAAKFRAATATGALAWKLSFISLIALRETKCSWIMG